ncbi:hypothetical protein HDC92_001815 [Pedobacter sp. AK017]|uniref:hypothetical protein n=1 Tax=Pedobacter sp. AK017 TaxID=2723073 RepID=UPI001613E66C|nr:hypothetical protein [Pedobacter sp. AK017]MBB5438140.1 hypothetical protein [Pedobacter sp. AK017]
MKKLFFAALLATAGIGGAFGQAYFPSGSNSRTIICDDTQQNCATKYNVSTAYTVPFSSGNQGLAGTVVDLSFLEAEL